VTDQIPGPGPADASAPAGVNDTSVPHSARIWNYWLGGKDNYPVDQQAGNEFLQVYPGMVDRRPGGPVLPGPGGPVPGR